MLKTKNVKVNKIILFFKSLVEKCSDKKALKNICTYNVIKIFSSALCTILFSKTSKSLKIFLTLTYAYINNGTFTHSNYINLTGDRDRGTS